MNWTTLAEAVCPPSKSPKMPPTEPDEQKQAGPGVLQRAVASISGKRALLTKAADKIAKAKAKANKSSKEKDAVTVACLELKAKAAENRLLFVLNRWDKLVKLAEKNLDLHLGKQQNLADVGKPTDEIDGVIAKLQAVLALGGQQSGHGREHAEKYGDEGFKEPPFLALKFDYNSYSGLSSGGTPFDVAAHVEKTGLVAAPSGAATAVVEPDPAPEPQLKQVADVSASEKAKLVAAMKMAVLKAVVAGEKKFDAANAAALAAGFAPDALDAEPELGKLTINSINSLRKKIDDLTPDEHAGLVTKAKEIVQGVVDEFGPEASAMAQVEIGSIKAMRAVSVGVLGDSHLTLAAAKSFVDQAKAAWFKEPKPFDQHTVADQEKIKQHAAGVAAEASVGPDGAPSITGVAMVLKSVASNDGLGLSSAAALTLAQLAIANLPKEELKAESDEAGFLKEIDQKLIGLPAAEPIPMTFGGVVAAMDEQPDVAFIGMMSHYHIDKVKGTPLATEIVKIAIAAAKSQWNETKLKKLVFDHWNEMKAAGTTLHQTSFVNHAKVWVLNKAEAIKDGGWDEAILEFGGSASVVAWLGGLWSEWEKAQKPQVDVEKATKEFVDNVAGIPNFDPAALPSDVYDSIIEFAAKHYNGNTNTIIDAIEAALAAKPVDVEDDASISIAQHAADTAPTGVGGKPKPKLIALPPGIPDGMISSYTKKKKLSSAGDLTHPQKTVLSFLVGEAVSAGLPWTKAGKLKTNLGGVVGGIAKQFKIAHLAAGLKLTINKKIVAELLNDHVSAVKHPDYALHDSYMTIGAGTKSQALTFTQMDAFEDMAQSVFVDKKWENDPKFPGPFASKKQQKFFASLVAKCEALAPPEPADTHAALSPTPPAAGGSVSQLFGMSEPELLQFASGAPMPGTKMAPVIGSGWTGSSKDLQDSGGSAGSAKMFLSATADGKKYTGTKGKAPANFMAKLDGYRSLGESAANRMQALIGLGGVGADGYLMKHNGETTFMQWFPVTPNGRNRYGHGGRPWMGMVGHGNNAPPEDERRRLTHGLQLAAVSNWLIDDKDDHGGNFTFDEQGRLHGLDHGQAGKFFDSGGTLLSTWDWTTDDIANKDGNASLETNKGWPKRLLKDWASGADLADGKLAIPILPLSDPAFEQMISRAEGIPDDIYDKMWRPYAVGATKRGKGKLAKYSHNPKDKTVDGFVQGMQDRRKNVRAQVTELYAMLANKRASALKAHGDTRSLAEIEAEVREQLGIDVFAAGGKATVSAAVANAATPTAEEIASWVDAPGWDESKLPKSSHVPDVETVKKWGVKGYDMSIGGDAIKDGRVTFRQIGDVPMVDFRLDNQARAALQARLPGYAGGSSAPPKPSEPYLPTFTPPPKPAFADKSAPDLFDMAIGAAGFTSAAVKPNGHKVTSAEKYIRKWAKGAIHPDKTSSAAAYIKTALAASRKLKVSADPIEAAAGAHYEDQLLKFGSEEGEHGWTFKNQSDVPDDEKTIKEFEPTMALKEAQAKAKADGETAYAAAVEVAKGEYDKTVQQLKDQHTASVVVWQEKYDAWSSGSDANNAITGAVKLNRPQQPIGAKQDVAEGKAGGGSTWDGTWGDAWYAGGASYEIDLTDAVSQLGGVATGEKDSRFVIRYNTGRTADIAPTNVAKYKVGLPAFSGKTTIQFPKGATKKQMQAMMKRAFEVLGIDARPASGEDHELNYVRKMAWLLGIEGAHGTAVGGGGDVRWHKVEPPAGSRRERADFWIGQLEKHLGYDPRHAPELNERGEPEKVGGKVKTKKGPDGKPLPNPAWKPIARHVANRTAHRRVDYTDEAMVYQLTLDDPHVPVQQSGDRLGKILQGTLMSSAERTANGILMQTKGSSGGAGSGGGKEGSADDDALTGGALAVFLYNRRVSNHAQMGGMGKVTTRMIFHPSIHLNTNTYAVPGDSFGSKVSKSHTRSRHKTLDERRQLVEIRGKSSGSAETMAMDQLDIFHNVLFYKLDEPKRTNTIKKLKESGVLPTNAAGQHLMGMPPRPVEEVIVTDYDKKAIKAVLAASAVSKEWSA